MQEFLHQLSIEQRKNITVSGVDSVKAFSSTRIELVLVENKMRLTIIGENLKINGFSKTSGSFTATGLVESVKYGGGLKSRIFR